MQNPEKIEIEGLKTIHKLCKFGADHNMEGCSFTEIVERMFDKLAKAQAVPEWIWAEDELPKDGAKVLCYGRQFMCVGVFDGDDFFDPLDGQSFVKDCVTHWVQLPASPKAQEQKR